MNKADVRARAQDSRQLEQTVKPLASFAFSGESPDLSLPSNETFFLSGRLKEHGYASVASTVILKDATINQSAQLKVVTDEYRDRNGLLIISSNVQLGRGSRLCASREIVVQEPPVILDPEFNPQHTAIPETASPVLCAARIKINRQLPNGTDLALAAFPCHAHEQLNLPFIGSVLECVNITSAHEIKRFDCIIAQTVDNDFEPDNPTPLFICHELYAASMNAAVFSADKVVCRELRGSNVIFHGPRTELALLRGEETARSEIVVDRIAPGARLCSENVDLTVLDTLGENAVLQLGTNSTITLHCNLPNLIHIEASNTVCLREPTFEQRRKIKGNVQYPIGTSNKPL